MKKANLILTDSGGIQEEAISFGTPVLVTREVTERPEGLQIGAVKLVGTKEPTLASLAIIVAFQTFVLQKQQVLLI